MAAREFIEESLMSGKSVHIREFGTFCFELVDNGEEKVTLSGDVAKNLTGGGGHGEVLYYEKKKKKKKKKKKLKNSF